MNVYCPGADKILPRPISLCAFDAESGEIRLVYRIAGKGTAELSRLQAGETVEILGPLGNGFPLEEAAGKRVLLAGGGIGIPPMLKTAMALKDTAEVTAVLGYREIGASEENSGAFLLDEFRRAVRTCVSADRICGEEAAEGDVQCTVLDAIRQNDLAADVIFACGPKPMLRALKAYAAENGIVCFLSLEERMACGIGACLACVCETKEKDSHSQVNNRRVCKDGPVFRAEEVIL